MYAVLFDIDGTLLDSGGAGQKAFAETFCDEFQLTEFPPNISFAGRSDRAIALQIMELSGIEPSPKNWQRFCASYQPRIDKKLAKCQGSLLPGVIELLDILQQDKHTTLGLLTGNTEFGARAKTTFYGLAGRFAFGGYGDTQTERDKIAVEAKAAAEKHLAQKNAEPLCGTMVIGDTPADVRCGRAINAFVVAVATGGFSQIELAACEPDLVLEDLTDSTALLAEVAVSRQRCLQPTT